MLTLRRFRSLAASYGADLQRWPEPLRAAAQALLHESVEARAAWQKAQALDAAIAAAGTREDSRLWRAEETDAALARLRSGVAARIVPPAPRARRFFWPPLGVFGMATGSAVAVVAGLLIGSMYGVEPVSDGLLAALQPAPIHILQD